MPTLRAFVRWQDRTDWLIPSFAFTGVHQLVLNTVLNITKPPQVLVYKLLELCWFLSKEIDVWACARCLHWKLSNVCRLVPRSIFLWSPDCGISWDTVTVVLIDLPCGYQGDCIVCSRWFISLSFDSGDNGRGTQFSPRSWDFIRFMNVFIVPAVHRCC